MRIRGKRLRFYYLLFIRVLTLCYLIKYIALVNHGRDASGAPPPLAGRPVPAETTLRTHPQQTGGKQVKTQKWLFLIVALVGIFALACGSAPTAAPAAAPQQPVTAPAPAQAPAAPAPQAPQAPQAAAPAAPAAPAATAVVSQIVAAPQAPVTQAAAGRSTGQSVHINMAASQVDPLAGFPNEAGVWASVDQHQHRLGGGAVRARGRQSYGAPKPPNRSKSRPT